MWWGQKWISLKTMEVLAFITMIYYKYGSRANKRQKQ